MLSDYSFHILAINKNRLDYSILGCEIHINSYSIVRFWGGVAINVKNSTSYVERKYLVPDNFEMICIEITKQHSRPFIDNKLV